MLADARVLHSAYRNQTDERRTLVLAWHRRPETVPAYWTDEVPAIIAEATQKKNIPARASRASCCNRNFALPF